MTTFTQNVVAPVSTPAVVVANSSINLDALGGKAKIVVSNTTAAAEVKPFDELVSMETARVSWETTELAHSNNRLYSILEKAYRFYLVMKRDENEDLRQSQKDAMEQFIAQTGYTFMPSTHDMTRVVKCVFGLERRRVSAYSIALREALRQQIEAINLIEFLQENGGVEQIRMGGTKPLSTTKRAELARTELLSNVIGTIAINKELIQADDDWADKQVVLVATYRPNGELELTSVIRHDGAVNTALAAAYSQAKAKERKEISEAKKQELEIARKNIANEAKLKKIVKQSQGPKKRLTKAEKLAKEEERRKLIASNEALLIKLGFLEG
jgi:hypothetical protein